MTIQTAEKIINDFGKVLSKSVHPHLFQPKSNLPCSVARIKFAIYRYVIELIRLGRLNKETAEMLIIGYSSLSYFLADQETADQMNRISELKDDPHPDKQLEIKRKKELIHALALYKEILNEEIQEFIRECILWSHKHD
jgi:hypothetical protein